MPLIHNFKRLNAYRASRERERVVVVVVVVGLSIVMPTTILWSKVEVGLGLGNLGTVKSEKYICLNI